MVAADPDILNGYTVSTGWVDFIKGSDQYILFTTAGRDSTSEWIEYLTTDSRLVATEPQETEVGGEPAAVLDIRLSGEPFTLFGYAPQPLENASWEVVPGGTDRYLIDFDDVTVAIFAEAPEADFEDWIATVEATLATLEWNPAG
jgi:hypothetical protein